jgi:hypothetical protein
MSDTSPWRRFEEQVDNLERVVRCELELNRRFNTRSIVLVACLSVVVLVFLGVHLARLKREFSHENLSKSLETEMKELSPLAFRELDLLGKVVVPVYFEEAKRQLEVLRPILAERFEGELDQFTTDVATGVDKVIDTSLRGAIERVERQVLESYPSLDDPVKREILSRRIREVTESAIATAVGNFHSRFASHIDSVGESLTRFDLSDDHTSEVDLRKQFIHIWLQLLDEEIQAL